MRQALAMLIAFAAVQAVAAPPPPSFDEHVLPIFREKCCGCHNADKKQGGLDLTSYGQALAGGSSGEVIAPGDAKGSYLWQLASHTAEPKMPPEADRIPTEMLDVIERWIAGGAIERTGGKAVVKKKVSLEIDPRVAAQPDGPPVMPPRLPLDVSREALRPLAATGLAASPHGPLVAVGSRGQVTLHDASTLAFLGVLPFPVGDAKTVRFSRNARLLLAGGGTGAKNGSVVLWDVATAREITRVGDEFDQVLAADVTADQKFVAIGGPQKVVRLLRTSDGGVDGDIRKHTDWITAIEFSPDGTLFATGDRAGNAFLWETRGAREDAVLKGHTGGITAVAWRGDGKVVATASEDGKIRLWNAGDGEKLKEWDGHPGGVLGLAWLADGRLASCGRDKKAVLWKADGVKEKDFPLAADIALRVAVTSDQSRLLVGDLTGTVAVYELATGASKGSLDTNPPRLEKRLLTAEAEAAKTPSPEASQAVERWKAELEFAKAAR